MDLLTMAEAFVVGGLVVLGLVIAVVYEAARRRKKNEDGPDR